MLKHSLLPSFARTLAGRLVWAGISLLLGACLLLSACSSGFVLRGSQSPLMSPLKHRVIVITGNISDSMRTLLEKKLKESGAEITNAQPRDGMVNLRIDRFEEDRIVSAYSAVRQVREFNHVVELVFTAYRLPLTQEKDRITDTVRTQRLQAYDNRFVLGSAEEERLIKQELRQEVARLLALRLKAIPGM